MKRSYKMSSVQKRIFVVNQTDEKGVAYNIPIFMQLSEAIDIDCLQRAINQLIKRHEILRTTFAFKKGEFLQIVSDCADIVVQKKVDNRDLETVKEEFIEPFNLLNGPLLRIAILENNNQNYLFFDIHHIICDGESLGVLFGELSAFFNGEQLPPLKLQYKNFSAWQNKKKYDTEEQYWLKKNLEKVEKINFFPDALDFDKNYNYQGKTYNATLDMKSKVVKHAAKNNVTEFMLFFAVFSVLLHKVAFNQGEFLIGTPISGREHPEFFSLIGMFVNTLALKNQVDAGMSFNMLLENIQIDCLDAYDNQGYPLEALVNKLNNNSKEGSPISLDVMFAFQQGDIINLKLGNTIATAIPHLSKTAKFNLTLTISGYKNYYGVSWEFKDSLYKEESIHFLHKHYVKLLEELLEHPELPIGEISMLQNEEYAFVTHDVNQTKADLPDVSSILELFDVQVNKKAGHTAVQFGEQKLSYQELNDRSSVVAAELKKCGVNKGDYVGIIGDKNCEAIIGILGIVKAGAAYVPIDQKYPQERIQYLLKDSGCKVLLLHRKNNGGLACPAEIQTINIGQIKSEESSFEVNLENNVNDTAYLIYTSGSTGNPKGVRVTHKNIIRLVKNTNYVDFDGICIGQTGSLAFDASTFEIWGALLNGGTIQLLDGEVLLNPEELKREIRDKKINTMFITTALFNQLINIDPKVFQGLTQLMFGGEATSEEHVRTFMKHNKNIKFSNVYGPTENTTFSLFYPITEETMRDKTPIGKPITNTRAYIMNGMDVCGIGVPGELCLGGDGVAKGYLNQEKPSRENFVPSPYEKGDVLYRTGDLTRWLPDGNIEFLGRIDNQVKIRGFRVELGEIENKIRQIEGIEDAIVTVQGENENKHLGAYVIQRENISEDRMKEILQKTLPEYMIPKYIMSLDSFPINKNGKIEKKLLPLPLKRLKSGKKLLKNKKEKVLAIACEEVLGVDVVEREDSFFELGGDSIKAIRVVSKVREHGYALSVVAVMQKKTIKAIAEKMAEVPMVVANQEEVTGSAELLPIQKEFFRNHLKNPNHFNQSMLLEVAGKVEIDVLNAALEAVLRHHDQLHAIYDVRNESQIIRRMEETESLEIKVREISSGEFLEETIAQETRELQEGLRIEEGRLVTGMVFNTEEKSYVFLSIHHLVVDGVSWRILVEDLGRAYELLVKGKEPLLPLKTSSYKEWGTALLEYRESEAVKEEETYWREVEGKVSQSTLKAEKDWKTEGLGVSEIVLDERTTTELLEDAGRAYNTEINDLLLSALGRALKEVTGEDAVPVNLEGHGREEIKDEISVDRTVGWFTTIYPIVLKVEGGEPEIRKDIRKTKEMLRRIPKHGIGYGVLKYQKGTVLAGTESDITFNYLGEFGQEKNEGYFRNAGLSSGEDVSKENRFGNGSISVNGLVSEKRLRMDFSYDKGRHEQEKMEQLAESFERELRGIIKHCLEKEETEPTASDYGELVWSDEEFIRVYNAKKEKGIEKIYPLTAMQEGMLYHKLEAEESSGYVVQNVFRIKGMLEEELLKESLNVLSEKHEVLRSAILYEEVKEPRQAILREQWPELTMYDLSEEMDAESHFQKIKEKDIERGFDLGNDRLIRAAIVKFSENEHCLILSFHHIIVDGWCLSILMGDLVRNYDRLLRGVNREEVIGNPTLGVYEEYVRYIRRQGKETAMKYWKDLLGDYEEQSWIRPEGNPERVEEEVLTVSLQLDEESSRKIAETAARYGATPNTVVETAWGIVLQRYNNRKDAVYGKVVSGRNVPVEGAEDTVGLFINTIPVRVKTKEGMQIGELLEELQEQGIESSEHDHHSLADIQKQSDLGNELIQTLVAYENYYIREETEEGLKLEVESAREQTNYTITISAYLEGNLHLNLMYDTSKYGREEAERILGRLGRCICQIGENAEMKVSELELLDEREKEQVINEFNGTEREYPKEKTIVELFKEQVRENGKKTAVSCEEGSLTYEELDEKSDAVAGLLLENGIEEQEFVGVIGDKNCEAIIGILGILKAGAAYMPIDKKYPEERIRYILKDSHAKIVLHHYKDSQGTQFANSDLKEFNLMTVTNSSPQKNRAEYKGSAENLAYLMYTSGTTGNPKGAMIEQHNVVRLVKNTNYVDFDDIRIGQTGSLAFDASTFEIWGALLNGGTVDLLPEEILLEPENLKQEIKSRSINTMFLTTALFNQLVAMDPLIFSGLQQLLFGGEATSEEHVKIFVENNKGIHFANVYGPTENTTFSLHYPIVGTSLKKKTPIGKPIMNTQAYTLNEMELCGIGMPGELCLGGEGVARGYLNQEKMSEEKFVASPYKEGDVLYRTGDLVRWLPDGNIEFLGRIDDQVKIRGFRIELGEIESELRKIPKIEDAVVIMRERDGEKYLAGYVQSRAKIEVKEITENLESCLPEYMIPRHLQVLEKFPVNKSGKIDKKMLPGIQFPENIFTENEYGDKNILERIENICKKIIGTNNIDVNKSFMENGGHSLLALRLINEIMQQMSKKLEISDILKAKTIKKIAIILESKSSSIKDEILLEETEEIM